MDAEFCASQAPYIRNCVRPGQILQLTWTSQRWAGEPDYVWANCPTEGRPMLTHVLLLASPRPARTKRPWRVMTTQWPIFFFNNATFQTPGQPSSSDSRLYWTNFFELSWRKFSPSDSRANTLGGASLRPPTDHWLTQEAQRPGQACSAGLKSPPNLTCIRFLIRWALSCAVQISGVEDKTGCFARIWVWGPFQTFSSAQTQRHFCYHLPICTN